MTDILEELNEKQKEAVSHKDGPLLIVAGAGAGKTRTLTHRIAHLILQGVSPREILAITFTNKAAKEMRERTDTLLSEKNVVRGPEQYFNKPFVSTFHALGVHILRESGSHIGIPKTFSILDQTDVLATVKEALKQRSLDPKQFEPRKIHNIISAQKNDLISREDFAQNTESNYLYDIVAEVWEVYDRLMCERKSLDFDDLIQKPVQLLKRNEQLRAHYQNTWKYIHIDEYQDTNTAQYELSRLLAENHKNICVVGDTDQNIYSWRGANIKNMLSFEQDYPEATTILLEQNYRSTKNILEAANQIIQKNQFRVEKNLFTQNDAGDKISLYSGFDEESEARFVGLEVASLLSSGVKADEIAVLYRANFQSRVLESALMTMNIPYQVLGVKFFERKEVKDILSYLRASLNPDGLHDIKRIINTPARGIGKVTITKLFAGQKNELPQKTQEKIRDFYNILDDIRKSSSQNKPSETLKLILKRSGLETKLKNGTEEDLERLENLRELVTLATKYDTLPPEEGIEKLLSDAALATDQDSLEKPQKAVKLMTVHAAKGLEFPYVFITGLEQDLFPHHKFDENLSKEDREEERRLFYVALTRAEKKLFLSFASSRTIYGSKQVSLPSEFLADIDESLFEQPEDVYTDGNEGGSPEKVVYLDF